MAVPLTAEEFIRALRTESVNVAEFPGWRTHNRSGHGAWGPVVGVVIHHTAGTDSLHLCYDGRTDLPGPLCHTHLSKAGTATLTASGRANHAGTFAQNANDAVVGGKTVHPRPDAAEPVDGNAHYYGLEIENLGDGKDPYPPVQYDQAVRWAAALCRAHGWTADSVIGHKEGTRRKTDPSFSMDDFRKAVAERLKPVPRKPPKTPVVDLSNTVRAFEEYPRDGALGSVRTIQTALNEEGLYTWELDGVAGPRTRGAYKAWQKRLGLVGQAADGIPGEASLKALGKAHGFKVTP